MRTGHRYGRRAVGLSVAVVALVATVVRPVTAYPRPGAIERVSVASDGTEGAGNEARSPAISADGRYVAFISYSNLVADDTNNGADIFVHDRLKGTTERVSVASDGHEGSCATGVDCGAGGRIGMSADGRFVVFFSSAPNLVPGDTNGYADVFVHDRLTRTTERVSVATDGTQGNNLETNSDPALWASISSDGRYVAFTSSASNLVAGDTNSFRDVFVRDRVDGTTQRVSVSSDGLKSGGHHATISSNGRYVAFDTGAALVPQDTNNASDVYVSDIITGAIERISVASDGTEGLTVWNMKHGGPSPLNASGSMEPSISANGRYVAFRSTAENLVPADTNSAVDVFVHDRWTGTTERVSVDSDGAEIRECREPLSGSPASPLVWGATDSSLQHSISADGRYVVFATWPFPSLHPYGCDYQFLSRLWVHDRLTGTTERIDVGPDGAPAEKGGEEGRETLDPYPPGLSAGGRYVAFRSLGANLVPGDTNERPDIFVRDRGPELGIVGSLAVTPSPGSLDVSGRATLSGEVLAEEFDPRHDADPPASGTAGTEIVDARLIYRPEPEDLHLRVGIASLPPSVTASLASVRGQPGLTYGTAFTVDSVRYEIAPRDTLENGGTDAPYLRLHPAFTLYRCAPACTEVRALAGGVGTTGNHVLVTIPLSSIGAREGSTISSLRAFVAVGTEATGALRTIDDVRFQPMAIPAPRVELGIAPASASEAAVTFGAKTPLAGGAFDGQVGTSGMAPGTYRVWARACLGEPCGPAVSSEVELS